MRGAPDAMARVRNGPGSARFLTGIWGKDEPQQDCSGTAAYGSARGSFTGRKFCESSVSTHWTCSEALAKDPGFLSNPASPAHHSHPLLQPQGLLAFPGTPQTVSHPRVSASQAALPPVPSEQPQDHSVNALPLSTPVSPAIFSLLSLQTLCFPSVVRAGC